MNPRNAVATGLLIAALLGMSALADAAPTTVIPPSVSPVEAGRIIAERDCAACHAIGPVGESPFEGAPRWRDLHNDFDVGDLAEALAEGITVGHQDMPARPFEPAEVEALIAYLRSLETAQPSTTPQR